MRARQCSDGEQICFEQVALQVLHHRRLTRRLQLSGGQETSAPQGSQSAREGRPQREIRQPAVHAHQRSIDDLPGAVTATVLRTIALVLAGATHVVAAGDAYNEAWWNRDRRAASLRILGIAHL